MRAFAYIPCLMLLMLGGCTSGDVYSGLDISRFINLLRDQGIDGTLQIDTPSNDDIDYIANYVISKYTSTRILSFFKCTSVERAEENLKQALKNPKMSGQTRNGTMIMTATFYPPDEEAVVRIAYLFRSFEFD